MTPTMMPQSDSDVLAEIVEPTKAGLSPEAARAILELRFNDSAIQRLNELAEKNRAGALTDAARPLRVGSFLNLIQAKARVSLAI